MSVKSKSGLTSHGGINIKLPLIIFEEDDTVICYCPTLDLSGYGYDENEAIKSYNYVMDEYLRHTTENNTLEKDLKRLGWQVKKNLHSILPPPITKVLENNNNFKRVFEKFDYKKLNTNFRFPALS